MRCLNWKPRAYAALAVGTAVIAGMATTAGASTLPAAGLPGTGSLAPATGSAVGSVPVVGPAVGSILGSQAPGAAATPAPTAVHSASASPTLAVNPSTNLTNNETVNVTASGMHANAYGSVLECNLANNEPTVQVEGNAVPVGCTNPLQTITGTDASGGFTKTFVIHTGTIGPPAQGTDSAGNSASADAAKYPCPPTPAQQAAGTTCDMVYGDTSGDQATTPLGFAASSSSPSGSTGATASSAGGTGSAGSATFGASGGAGGSGSSGSLAFTGVGPGLRLLAGTGMALVGSGMLLLAASLRLRRRHRVTPSSA